MLETLDIALSFAALMLAISLIIMSITQAIVSVLALRGAKLRRGVKDLIQHATPSLAQRIADGGKKLDDVVDGILRHELISDSAILRSGRWGLAAAIKREELVPVINAVLAQSGLQALVDGEKERLERWFDSFMTRVSQWFTMNTRWITVALSAVLAIAIHLDAGKLATTIQDDKELRGRLAGMAGSLLDYSPEEVDKLEAVYRDTLRTFAGQQAARLRQPNDAGGDAIQSRREAENWLIANAADRASASELIRPYNEALDDALESGLQRALDRATTLRRSLSTAGLTLSLPRSPDGKWLPPPTENWPGIIASILLLSLGAPFWFNVLKNLTSLKSAVTGMPQEQKPPPPSGPPPAAMSVASAVVPPATAAVGTAGGPEAVAAVTPVVASPAAAVPAVALLVGAAVTPPRDRLPDLG